MFAWRYLPAHQSHLRQWYWWYSEDHVSINSTTDAFYDYAIEWDGTDLHVIACNIGDINTQPGINNGGTFSRTVTLSNFATDHGKTNTDLNWLSPSRTVLLST